MEEMRVWKKLYEFAPDSLFTKNEFLSFQLFSCFLTLFILQLTLPFFLPLTHPFFLSPFFASFSSISPLLFLSFSLTLSSLVLLPLLPLNESRFLNGFVMNGIFFTVFSFQKEKFFKIEILRKKDEQLRWTSRKRSKKRMRLREEMNVCVRNGRIPFLTHLPSSTPSFCLPFLFFPPSLSPFSHPNQVWSCARLNEGMHIRVKNLRWKQMQRKKSQKEKIINGRREGVRMERVEEKMDWKWENEGVNQVRINARVPHYFASFDT